MLSLEKFRTGYIVEFNKCPISYQFRHVNIPENTYFRTEFKIQKKFPYIYLKFK